MKCFTFPEKIKNFDYPEEMVKLIQFLTDASVEINCDHKSLEKLWYIFSETYCAQFLIVDDETFKNFLEWIEGNDFDVDDVDHMDYYGNKLDDVYRPWDNVDDD